jgi:hypothetical protein
LDKFCVFCGGRPSDKTREHVVPQWLLKMTGDPGRSAYFGRDWLSPNLDKRIYSWRSFTFPACEECNSKWSELEGKMRTILGLMLDGGAVTAAELHLLLDWLDKVRVGLWLGMLYLNKNYRGLIPQFHINDRVAQKDRVLLIFESDEYDKGIGVSGCDTPIFHTTPSVHLITINQLHFVTVSSDFLIAERFGWSFVKDRKMVDIDTDGFMGEICHGTQRTNPPIMNSLPDPPGCVLLQPIAHQHLRHANLEEFRIYK